MIWIDLLYNLAMLVALSVVSGFVDTRWKRTTRMGVLIQGVVFGGSAAIGMLRPFVFAPGLIFDGRSVMISLGGLFFGPWTAAVACLMTIPLRMAQGGPGTTMGVLVILSSAAIGVGFHLRRKHRPGDVSASTLLLFGLAVHLAMLVMTLALPPDMILPVFKRIGWPVMLTYPLATVLIGKILSDQAARAQFLVALQESEQRFRAIFNSTFQFTGLMTPDGTLTEANQTALDFAGTTLDEVVGRPFWETRWWRDNAARVRRLQDAVARAAAGEFIRYEVELQGRATTANIDFSLKPVRDRTGRVILLIPEGRDITERKQADEALREAHANLERRVIERTSELASARDRAESADRVKSAFLATMSHELRTPLNCIIGFSRLLLLGRTGPLNEEQARQIGLVGDSGERLLALINDVLDISKIEAGQIDIAEAAFDLPESIHKVVQTVTPLAERKGLPLITRIAPDVNGITSDRRRVEQVLLNLLSNAIKFTEEGQVTLTGESLPGALRISITDTGIGICRADLDKLFHPFRQLDNGLTRQHEGTGLGLVICKRLVERLGGTISVESEWGRGSTFQFTLPTQPGSGS